MTLWRLDYQTDARSSLVSIKYALEKCSLRVCILYKRRILPAVVFQICLFCPHLGRSSCFVLNYSRHVSICWWPFIWFYLTHVYNQWWKNWSMCNYKLVSYRMVLENEYLYVWNCLTSSYDINDINSDVLTKALFKKRKNNFFYMTVCNIHLLFQYSWWD